MCHIYTSNRFFKGVIMKKIVLVGLILSITMSVVGCSKKNQFESAINKKLKEDYSCLRMSAALESPDFDFPSSARDKYDNNNMEVIIKRQKNGQLVSNGAGYDETKEAQLNALVKVGLLKKSEETQPAMDNFRHEPIAGESFLVELYNLTSDGEKAIQGDNEYNRQLCYANRQVDDILNYVEEKIAGHEMAEIKYSYKYVDVAQWAKNKEVLAVFPEIDQTLNEKDKTAVIDLVKTNNGWQTDL
jgi:hypothetical protein